MKLLRAKQAGRVRLGVAQPDGVVFLDALQARYPTMLSIIAGGEAALADIRALLAQPAQTVPLAGLHLLAPLERPGKFLAIGMNYQKHVEEAKRFGIPTPQTQYWFNKQTSCMSGPYDDIVPGATGMLDYEVELGVVIGRPAKNAAEASALDHVFGYTVVNDVSARDWQRQSPTFTIAKSFDTHGPVGPWIVTADEIADPQNLALRCAVNDQIRQSSNTGDMVYTVAQQIAYLSSAFTLEPGDLLSTGTPAGVGAAMQPPQFLQPGDRVRCEVEHIGAIENKVAANAA